MRYPGLRNILVVGALSLVAALAAAQTAPSFDPPNPPADAVKWVNKLVGEFPEADRMENVLLPALAAMAPPPGAIATPMAAAMLAPGGKGAAAWDAAAKWAQAEPQQKAIEALKKVTEEKSRYVFSLPYGASASPELTKTGLIADLGTPPMLVGADFKYLPAFTRLGSLVQIEATRLAQSGEGKQAEDLLVHWLRFARGIADRQFYHEKFWAFQSMRLTLERLRDIIYTYPQSIDEAQIVEVINSLDERVLAIDRITLPEGTRISALQLIAMTINAKAQPNVDTFGPVLARLAAGDRPLRLFGQAAHWQKLAATHGDWFTVIDALKGIYNDWQFRWGLDPQDDLLKTPMEYFKFDRAKASILAAALPDVGRLFNERLLTRTELAGTRMALGANALAVRQKNLPKTLFLIRGRYTKEIATDPYDPKRSQPLQYFVPIRDQPQDERKGPQPHVISVTPPTADDSGASSSPSGAAGADAIAKQIEQMPAAALAQVGQSLLAQMQKMAKLHVTKDNFREKLDEVIASGGAFTPPGQAANAGTQEGTPDPKMKEFVLGTMETLFKSPTFAKLYADVVAGDAPTPDALQAAAKEAMLASAAVMSGSSASAAPAGAPGAFTVPLDDTVFVLYSVGPDGKPNWAKSVGAGGSDILLWPPVMSLVREHAKK